MVIKSLKIKFFLNDTVFPILSWVNKFFSHDKNRILIYCNLSLRDNNKAIYDYLIANGYNEKYKIVVSTSDYKQYRNNCPKNVSFVNPVKAILNFFVSQYVFYCIGKIPIKPGKGQKVIFMGHGMPMKAGSEGQLKGYKSNNIHYTHLMVTGKVFIPMQSRIYSCPENMFFVCGNPKCDVMYLPNPHYDFGDYEKIIFWAPTFRKSTSMNMNDSLKEESILPMVSNDDFQKLDTYLKSLKVKIVVKLHPEQDLSKYNIVKMDNFILLSHQDFLKKGMDIYRFMKQCDAMISDYSSIYYDFMLLDRPVGFTEDDLNDYAGKRGFSVDVDKFRPGHKMRNLDDLFKFIKDLAENKDDYKLERQQLNTLVNEDMEGNFCQKVLKIAGIE